MIILCGYGLSQPKPAPVAEAHDGPRCTTQYPRGVKPTKVTKRKPVCTNGELGSTWRVCTPQFRA